MATPPPPPKRPRHQPPPPAARTIADLAPEILLRFPPDDPACLARASAICRPWRRLVSDRAFLRSYRAYHRRPPMLGFVLNPRGSMRGEAQFVSTSSFRLDDQEQPGRSVIDARHGRVLLPTTWHEEIVVWDPVADLEWEIPTVPVFSFGWNAAVLCGVAGCDHLDCHGGPFRVAFVCADDHGIAFACTYSSESGKWSQPIRMEEPAFVDAKPGVLVGNTVYFACDPFLNFKFVGYDVAEQKLSVIWPPRLDNHRVMLITAEDGSLGFASVHNARLYLWLRKAGPDGDLVWARSRGIEHKTMLRTRGLTTPPEVVGFADGLRIIFARSVYTVYSMDLRSGHVRKVYTPAGQETSKSLSCPTLASTLQITPPPDWHRHEDAVT